MLIERYSEAVTNTAMRILRDSQKAQDVHQEVFLRILSRWHKFDGDVNWPGYLYRTTIRTALESVRRSKAEQLAEQQREPVASNPGPDWRLRAAELQQKLVACLAKLPKRQADVFVLSRIEGLEYDRVAELLGCSKETARVHLHRAIKSLARDFRDYLRK
ncbi:MAG: sigma-70 family RNA polymerase sigma factor [Sedimentisphaerales bacterium]|nr:sigma-70 family RNA polymerase sigma factor [Sedimentisphaerales bacterium]